MQNTSDDLKNLLLQIRHIKAINPTSVPLQVFSDSRLAYELTSIEKSKETDISSLYDCALALFNQLLNIPDKYQERDKLRICIHLHRVFKFKREDYYDKMLSIFLKLDFVKNSIETTDNNILEMQSVFQFDKDDIKSFALDRFAKYLNDPRVFCLYSSLYSPTYDFFRECKFTGKEVHDIVLKFINNSTPEYVSAKLEVILQLQPEVNIDKSAVLDKLLDVIEGLMVRCFHVSNKGRSVPYWEYIDKTINVFNLTKDELYQHILKLMIENKNFRREILIHFKDMFDNETLKTYGKTLKFDTIDKLLLWVDKTHLTEVVREEAIKLAKMTKENCMERLLNEIFHFTSKEIEEIKSDKIAIGLERLGKLEDDVNAQLKQMDELFNTIRSLTLNENDKKTFIDLELDFKGFIDEIWSKIRTHRELVLNAKDVPKDSEIYLIDNFKPQLILIILSSLQNEERRITVKVRWLTGEAAGNYGSPQQMSSEFSKDSELITINYIKWENGIDFDGLSEMQEYVRAKSLNVVAILGLLEWTFDFYGGWCDRNNVDRFANFNKNDIVLSELANSICYISVNIDHQE